MTVRTDTVNETSAALYLRNMTAWLPWLRTVAGPRADQFWYGVSSDNPANSGNGSDRIVSPKLSIVMSPADRTEIFLNWGRGFHSNDVRGATTTVEPVDRRAWSACWCRPPATRSACARRGSRPAQLSPSLWQVDIGSELVFSGASGTTEPSRPSRRTGIELAGYYAPQGGPLAGLILDADAGFSRARYRDHEDVGHYIDPDHRLGRRPAEPGTLVGRRVSALFRTRVLWWRTTACARRRRSSLT